MSSSTLMSAHAPAQRRGSLTIDGRGIVTSVDEVAASAFGAAAHELRGTESARAFALHGRHAMAWQRRARAGSAARTDRLEALEVYARQRDGSLAAAVFDATVADPDDTPSDLVVSVVTTELPASTELTRLRAELEARRAFGAPTLLATVVIDDDLVVSRLLTPAEGSDWEPWRLVGHPVLTAVHPLDRAAAFDAFTRAVAAPGSTISLSVRMRPLIGWVEVQLRSLPEDPFIHGVICHVMRPAQTSLQREPQDLLRLDPLTGLASRAGLQLDGWSELPELASATGALPEGTAAVIIDIVGLDQLNQDLGYDAGDLVVRATAQRLLTVVEPHRIARLGGGRFVIVGPYGGPPRRLRALARRVLRATALPVGYLTHQIPIEVVVGTATGGVDGLPGLLQRAGLSLSMFRLSADGEPQVFGPELTTETLRRARLVLGLRDLDYDAELAIVYQPIVELRTRAVVGREALLRWTHPLLGAIEPDIFIPLAESMGTIAGLGSWVLRRACIDAAGWESGVSLSVNVSTRQLSWAGFADEVASVLADSGLSPDRLVLEVTETAVLEQSEATARTLDRLSALGVRISLDDFGTGFSSLSLLHRLPIRELKIDKSFVAGLGIVDHSQAIVATVIDLALALGVSVVAEGVETPLQLEHLAALGCTLGQGFLLGRPAELD